MFLNDNDRLEEFKTYLEDKGYSNHTIEYIMSYARRIIRENLSQEEISQFDDRNTRKQLRYALNKLNDFERLIKNE